MDRPLGRLKVAVVLFDCIFTVSDLVNVCLFSTDN